MKKSIRIMLGLAVSVMMLLAFAGCGDSGSKEAAPPTPEEEATASLDATLSALKSADMEALKELGGEDVLETAEQSFGSEEDTAAVMKALFGHFDYKLGTPEVVDDTHINIPATVTNADMHTAVGTWFSHLMEYAISNPDIAGDSDALHAKTIEELSAAVDETAAAEDGMTSKEVVFPMVLADGKWDISEDVDDSVFDAILGGFMAAIDELNEQTGDQ